MMTEILRLENDGVDFVIQKYETELSMEYQIVISMQRVTACYPLKRTDVQEIMYALIDADKL